MRWPVHPEAHRSEKQKRRSSPHSTAETPDRADRAGPASYNSVDRVLGGDSMTSLDRASWLSRRRFFARSGLGVAALSSLLSDDGLLAAAPPQKAKATSGIFIFL